MPPACFLNGLSSPPPISKKQIPQGVSAFLVPLTGLEPVQYRYRGILSPLCLPIPPQRRLNPMIAYFYFTVKVVLRRMKETKQRYPQENMLVLIFFRGQTDGVVL